VAKVEKHATQKTVKQRAKNALKLVTDLTVTESTYTIVTDRKGRIHRSLYISSTGNPKK
jgi:hypothetical protein